jgi:hypothetical protein
MVNTMTLVRARVVESATASGSAALFELGVFVWRLLFHAWQMSCNL